MSSIRFFNEEVEFKLDHPRKTSNWIKLAVLQERGTISELNFIFCSDSFLHSINVKYLNHSTLTDIITFDNGSDANAIDGEIYISIPRVMENARSFDKTFDNELHRVIIHGVLHLIGYSDKTTRQKSVMRKKEDSYLSLRS
ncbi:MAG: rRNA maturation RNase YbeY [Chryseolinea sp.]